LATIRKVRFLEEPKQVYVIHLDKLFSLRSRWIGGWCGRCGRAFLRSDQRTVEIQKVGKALLVHAKDCLKKGLA